MPLTTKVLKQSRSLLKTPQRSVFLSKYHNFNPEPPMHRMNDIEREEFRRVKEFLTPERVEQFENDGYLILRNIATQETIDNLRAAMGEIMESFDFEAINNLNSLLAKDMSKFHKHFAESSYEIYPFVEKGAFDGEGNLTVPKFRSCWKVGHAMHDLHPVFERYSYSNMIKYIALTAHKFNIPQIVQSMYMFKNPNIGTAIEPHKDTSYLVTNPNSVQAVWMGLDEANTKNGCVWVQPGSHKQGPNVKHKRTFDPTVGNVINVPHFFPENGEYKLEGGVPCETEPGSMILFKGNVLHWSESNTSGKPRNAFALHLVEGDGQIEYDPGNWINRTVPRDCRGRVFRKMNR